MGVTVVFVDWVADGIVAIFPNRKAGFNGLMVMVMVMLPWTVAINLVLILRVHHQLELYSLHLVSEHSSWIRMETRQNTTKENLKRRDKELGELGATVASLIGKVDSKFDNIDRYMHQMNEKHEAIVSLLAKIIASQQERVEGSNSGSNFDGGVLSVKSGKEDR
ncbi:Hypothetical predicted protein [Olea europaea subsp. europaea]|uniref:Uncharacterized protein n=1 Tax=Olea europaea subsp. europaea TaxID=158383 RepID=A0A8S0RS75_OLEEU|nr:Hypothetical predicted protein [Olea europaea subsp. europaea]